MFDLGVIGVRGVSFLGKRLKHCWFSVKILQTIGVNAIVNLILDLKNSGVFRVERHQHQFPLAPAFFSAF